MSTLPGSIEMAKGRFKASVVHARFRRDGQEVELTFDSKRGENTKIVVDHGAISDLIRALIPMVEVLDVNRASHQPSDGEAAEFVEGPPVFHAVDARGVNWVETGGLALRLWTVERQEIQIQMMPALARLVIARLEMSATPTPGPTAH